MNYRILASGSNGNAVIIEDFILVDCGISYWKIKPYEKDLKIVLLTHSHKDHFKIGTIKELFFNRPLIKFFCGNWLEKDLISCGIDKTSIITYEKVSYFFNKTEIEIEAVNLIHDVPNRGYKIRVNDTKYCYITDTNSLNGIKAKNFDLYLIEANYTNEELIDRLETKFNQGKYDYESRVLKTHLNREKADKWLNKNAGINSDWVFMHMHENN
jgi:Cft2 family RNA processing exonuclease